MQQNALQVRIWLLFEYLASLLKVGARLLGIARAAQQLALVGQCDDLPVQVIDLALRGKRLLVIVGALLVIAESPVEHAEMTANQRLVVARHDAGWRHNRHVEANQRIPRAPLHQVVVQPFGREEVVGLLPVPAQTEVLDDLQQRFDMAETLALLAWWTLAARQALIVAGNAHMARRQPDIARL